VKTDTSYMRYRIAENRISPRGIPGYGEGFVGIDSDEHDEEGHITESMEVRVNMVEKRLGKLDLIKKDILPPKLFGDKDYDTLVVGWGSTFGAIKEAVEKIGSPKLAFLHVNQVYPLHQEIADSMKRAKRTVVVENNATSQFGKLVKVHLGIEADGRILKYNGLPFSVEELVEKISQEDKV
jgi:2-oxoglutarate ferredoxin oxidoreductase subunit alpha